jgi:type II secretory pathway component PulF
VVAGVLLDRVVQSFICAYVRRGQHGGVDERVTQLADSMRSMCRVEEDVWAAAAYPLFFLLLLLIFIYI